MNDMNAPRRVRCLLVWLAVTAVAAALAVGLVPAVLAPLPPAVAFDELLVRGCSAALVLCAVWAWVCTTTVVVELLRRHGRATRELLDSRHGVPAGVRRLVLLACGVALTGVVATPAMATPGPVALGPGQADIGVSDLPYPSRPYDGTAPRRPAPATEQPTEHRGTQPATGHAAARGPHERTTPVSVVVHPGDSLWSLAADHLPAGATTADTAAAWRLIYAANRDQLSSPHVIEPGQRLELPDLDTRASDRHP